MAKRPIGVTVAATLTMIIAIALFFFQLIFFLLSGVGGPTPSGFPGSGVFLLINLGPLLLAMYGFIVSINQFEGKKWAYYASIVFWVMLLVGFGFLAYVIDFLNGIIWLSGRGYFNFHGFLIFLASITPLVYSAGSLIYFLTKTPRS